MARVAQAQIQTCPACHGSLHVAQTLPGRRHPPSPGQTLVQAPSPRLPTQAARAPP
ncbi:MAG: hypothetical protein RIQ60_3242 [Pseudomonadota bacterium]|jgi:hypothetical protein